MKGITIRPAQPQDKEQVLAFCQQTFEWGDYILEAWDQWLSDPSGQLLVALNTRTPVALSHVAMASPKEAWLEGMRVDPLFRRAGIASLLLEQCVRAAWKMGAEVVRFATASGNTIVHHLAGKRGFERVGIWEAWSAGAVAEGVDPALQTLEDAAEAWDFIERSGFYRDSRGLFSTGWTFHQLTREKLEKRVDKKEVLAMREEGKLLSLAVIGQWHPREGLTADYITGEVGGIGRMAKALRAYAATKALSQVTTRVPSSPALREVLTLAGFERYTKDDLWIFEMKR